MKKSRYILPPFEENFDPKRDVKVIKVIICCIFLYANQETIRIILFVAFFGVNEVLHIHPICLSGFYIRQLDKYYLAIFLTSRPVPN